MGLSQILSVTCTCICVFTARSARAQQPSGAPAPAAPEQPTAPAAPEQPTAPAAQPAPAQSAPKSAAPVITLESPTTPPSPEAASPEAASPAPATPAATQPPAAAATPSGPGTETAARALPLAAPKPPPAPVRQTLKYAIAGEIGWNSLAGLGVNGTYNVIPPLSLDVGAGLSVVGYKAGVRIRGNLLESEWTPTAGVGYLFGSGTLGTTAESEIENEKVEFRLYHSHYVQGVLGMNYTGEEGFAFMGTVGYAWLLRENFKLVSGPEDKAANIKPTVHGGVVLATSFGWAF